MDILSDAFARTHILLGAEDVQKLADQHILIAGLGGVGSFVAESLARAGIGKLTLLDHDVVSASNINRQLVALHSTVGQLKTEVMAARLRDINPQIELDICHDFLYQSDAKNFVQQHRCDYIVDCIDSIACKAALILACQEEGVPVASSMGAGNRLDVSKVKVSRLKKTQICPLAREMRSTLRKLGGHMDYPVIYSEEHPRKALPHAPNDGPNPGRPRAVNGTISYMPALFGLMLSGIVIQAILGNE